MLFADFDFHGFAHGVEFIARDGIDPLNEQKVPGTICMWLETLTVRQTNWQPLKPGWHCHDVVD